jgi:hypothetical protein
MASLVVEDDSLEIRLSRGERLAAFHGDVVIPRSCVRGVEVLDPNHRVRGWRAPGTAAPFLGAYGTYRRRGHKEFLALRWRRASRRKAVRLTLEGHEFDAVAVSVPDAEAVVRELQPEQAAAPT